MSLMSQNISGNGPDGDVGGHLHCREAGRLTPARRVGAPGMTQRVVQIAGTGLLHAIEHR